MNTPAADLMTLLILAVVCLFFYARYYFAIFRPHWLKAERYRLFAVRDQIIRLVVEGKITEEDKIFDFLYRRVNEILPDAKPLSLRGFVSILKRTDLAKNAAEASALLAELKTRTPDVQCAAYALFHTTAEILLGRAFLLRLALRVGFVSLISWRGIKSLLSYVFKTETEAYRLYREMNETASKIASLHQGEQVPAYA